MSVLLHPAKKKKGFSARAKGKAAAVAPLAPPLFQEEAGESMPLPLRLRRELDGLGARHSRLAVWKGAMQVVLAGAVLVFIQTLLDYLLHLSLGLRAVFLAIDVAVAGYLIYSGPYRSLKKRPNLERSALLAQKKWPSLRGSLVAAVQFAGLKRGVPKRSAGLVRVLLTQVERETEKLRFKDVIPSRRIWRLTGGAVLAWMALGTLGWFTSPVSLLLLQRAGLSSAGFPAQTTLTAVSKDLTVSLDDNVQLEVQAQGVIPLHGQVLIRHQDGTQETLVVDSPPDRQGLFSLTVHNVRQPFQYRFEINDARTDEYQVKTRLTPLVHALDGTSVYPPYTGLPPQTVSANELSLLAGSTLKLHLTASTQLSHAAVVYQGMSGKVDMQIDSADSRIATAEIPIPAADLTGFTIQLVDKGGVASVNDPLYPIEIVADDPPTVRVVQPVDESLTVTLQTKLAVVFEVSDNYGLSRVRIHFEITPASTGADDPKAVESAPVDFDLKQINPKAGTVSTVTYPFAVGAQNPPWHEGDTVRYWVEAIDNNNVTGPGITLSSSQRLLVVTPEAKRDEIFQRLEDNANIMQDILKDQSDLNDQTRGTASQR